MGALTSEFAVPVVAIAYNRPRLARNLVSVLRRVKPRHVLIISDGPKPERHGDTHLVDSTRREFETIDWPCRIDRNYAETNLGCDQRIRSGLDWVFGIVDEAIILEDDIDAIPDFFHWAQRMLDVYRQRDDVAMICGHNPLIRWPEGTPGAAAVLSQRGGWLGWATYARAWNSVQEWDLRPDVRSLKLESAQRNFEPAIGELLNRRLYELQVNPSQSFAVDVDFTLKMAMSGHVSVCSPVNFIHHLGVGPDATHLIDCDETLFRLPRHELELPRVIPPLPCGVVDNRFDRARVFLELLVRAKHPAMVRRLARFRNLPMDIDFKLHLLPFIHADETAEILAHLRREGLDDASFHYWHDAVSNNQDCGSTP